jgi:hypothetical protein
MPEVGEEVDVVVHCLTQGYHLLHLYNQQYRVTKRQTIVYIIICRLVAVGVAP